MGVVTQFLLHSRGPHLQLSCWALKASHATTQENQPKSEDANIHAVDAADLREDAGRGGHSAVHHAVENGEQAVQRERLGPQEVVTGLSRGQVRVEMKEHSSQHQPRRCSDYLFIFLQEVGFLYFTMVLLGREPSRLNQNHNPTGCKQGREVSSHLQEEALVRACRVVGGQVGSDQQELGVVRQLHVGVSRQTWNEEKHTNESPRETSLHASPWTPGAEAASVPLTALHSLSSICCICSHWRLRVEGREGG